MMNLQFIRVEEKDTRNTFTIKMSFYNKMDEKDIVQVWRVDDFDEACTEIRRLIDFMNTCVAKYPRGKRGTDGYTNVPDYYRYFGDEAESDEIREKFNPDYIYWPAWEYEYPYQFTGYEIIYTDKIGDTYKVTG